MAQVIGQAGWMIDEPEQEPDWKHAAEYEELHRVYLTEFAAKMAKLAREDCEQFDWLIHQITQVMCDCVQLAKDTHSDG